MNKKSFTLVLSFVIFIFSSCSSETQDNKQFMTTTSRTEVLLEFTEETVKNNTLPKSETVTTDQTDILLTHGTEEKLTHQEWIEKTIIWTAPDGEIFYEDEAVTDGNALVFDKAIYRPSTGIYYDSISNPEYFNNQSYDFSGELIEYNEDDWRCVRRGDKINGYTVKKAETKFNTNEDAYLKEDGYIPLSNSILFEDNITLTGYLLYYSYDEPTFIQKGDLIFLPDESYMNMPLLDFYPCCSVISGDNSFELDELVFPVIYSDSLSIRVGNLFDDYVSNEDLMNVIGDGETTVKIKVEITLEELNLIFGDMMRSWGTSAKILSIREL